MLRLALGTRDGVSVFVGDGAGWRKQYRALDGEDIITLCFFPEDPQSLLAGSYGHGLFRVQEGGGDSEKLPFPIDHVRTLRFSPEDPATVFAGTEPAEIFRSQNAGESWESLEIRTLPQAVEWALPYSPRAGAVRTLILPPSDPFLVLAGIEQGGFLRSRDSGKSWHLEDRLLNRDIHHLAMWPENSFRLFAATGEGLYRSMNQGNHWERLWEDYTRAVAVTAEESPQIFAGPAADVGEGGSLFRSRDGGDTWERVMDGLFDDPLEEMVQEFYLWEELPGKIFALLSNGELYESGLESVRWKRILPEITGIQCMAVVRDV